ncbi:MAG: hypothetical protein KF884_05390 [Fimbriimonadaceae bacterium]|nr:hypothetical protein [Fimbriimonadaceae bacterium]QYK59518.1 MAG: hypothetical protein KF884_05390 [Fimbriimonadaceae bacterium]
MKRILGLGLAFAALPWAAAGQTDPASPQAAVAQIGGKTSFDLVRLNGDKNSVPLRNGQVKVGSERVTFRGRTLVRERDYFIDYVSGVVYLKVPSSSGEAVTVEYRYDPATGQKGSFGLGSSGSQFQGFTFQLRKEASLVMGLGVTERLGDGTVLESNVYGLNNSFSLGAGNLKGFFMVGDRKRAQTTSLMGEGAGTAPVQEGRGTAILQSLSAKGLGGNLQVDYQDVDEKFSGFQAVEAAGYDQATVQRLSHERGLKRTNFQGRELGGKGFRVGFGLRSVGDEGASIEWRDYSAKVAGMDLNYASHRVDRGFRKFKEIAESDREQLAKEQGMVRESLGLSKGFAGGQFRFNTTKIEADDSKGIHRRGFALETPTVKIGLSDQQIDEGFSRFNDLREGDRGQLAREGGLSREALSVDVSTKVVTGRSSPGPAGENGQPTMVRPAADLKLAYNRGAVRSDNGDFLAQDLSGKVGRFTFDHARREVEAGFTGLGALAREEVGNHLGAMVRMVNPGAGVQGPDWNAWGASAGLSRSVWRAGFDFGRGTAVKADQYVAQGETDRLMVTNYGFSSPSLNASWRHQDTGAEFGEVKRMTLTEQQALGLSTGFEKTDLTLQSRLGGSKLLAYSKMGMSDATGGAGRQTLSFSDKGLKIDVAEREVDASYSGLPTTVDPERDRFLGMIGFKQRETAVAWQLLPSVSLDWREDRSGNQTTGVHRFASAASAVYRLDKSTQIAASKNVWKNTDPSQTLIDREVETVSVSRDFGALGKMTVSEEDKRFNGVEDQSPDSVRQSVVYDAQLSKTTTVRSEHGQTRYENGERETLTSNTLAQQLTPRTGVSVTQTNIKRDGDKLDETHRHYGFWIDFGRNIRLNYKSLRSLRGETEGTLDNNVNVTPGEFQGIKLDSASYQRYGWDHRRDQHIGAVSLSNVKPLDWGFVKDVNFNYGVDTVRDHNMWQRENRSMGFGGRFGSFAFGFGYRSQTLPQSGEMAIDREFKATSDVTGKGWLRAELSYILRTLPEGNQVMVRNYNMVAEPTRGLQIQHTLSTNPLINDPNVLLGTRADPAKSNRWTIAYNREKSVHGAFTYEELLNQLTGHQIYASRLGLTLFADCPSPVYLEYVMADSNQTGPKQRSHGFRFRYDQRPGLNQNLSLSLGNVNWEIARPNDQRLQNWNLRLDYSLRF